MSIKNNKNNKNICLVYIYIWKYLQETKLHYYIVYYIFPDIKNIVLFSGILNCNKTRVNIY